MNYSIKHIAAGILTLVFSLFYISRGMRLSPILVLSIALCIFIIIILVKRKSNGFLNAGSYILITGIILASLLVLIGKGTGNLEGFELVMAAGIVSVAEIITLICYIMGILKKRY